jgi:hypothetical protein
MPDTIIRVLRGDKPVNRARVVLSFTWGQTNAVYTDSDGVAEVHHESTGHAEIFVDGSPRGSLMAPGRKTVHL